MYKQYYRRWTRIDKLALLKIRYERDMLQNDRHLVPVHLTSPSILSYFMLASEIYSKTWRRP